MATVDKPLAQPRSGERSEAERMVRPPRPFFLRSWFAFVVFIILVVAHIYGWQVAQIDPALLVQKAPQAVRILDQLAHPDIIARDKQQLQVPLQSLVGAETAPAEVQPVNSSQQVQPVIRQQSNPNEAVPAPEAETFNTTVNVSAGTVTPGQEITVSGSGFRPNTPGVIIWQSTGTNASSQDLSNFVADAQGAFTTKVTVPSDPDRVLNSFGFPNTLTVSQTWDFGDLYLSETARLVLVAIVETIFLALMGTTFAVVVSLPLSFLASHNIMSHSRVGIVVYTVARTILNILRAIEVLIVATIFVATVGIGPFAGVLALTLHSIASLGKLYSEAIESIDTGPIEAITATGANRLQVIIYAVVPQFIPQFISFTLYRWDINVRMATIIGFVGGGGIGFLLIQYINLTQWQQASVAIIAIAIVVIAMDYASAKIRAAVI